MEKYCDDDTVPVGSYLLLMAGYASVFTALTAMASKRSLERKQPTLGELSLLTVAGYKLSRIITMSFICSPIRAPFTTRGESLKGGEVQDVARGQGLQKAIGNLFTCPFCFNVWAATAFRFAFLFSPAKTMDVAYILSVAAAGDVLHHGYRSLREKSE